MPSICAELDVPTEISDIRYSSQIVTTPDSSLVTGGEAVEEIGKVQIRRVNREMKPMSKGNPSIENADKQDKRRSSSTVLNVRRVSVIKLPRQSALESSSIRSNAHRALS